MCENLSHGFRWLLIISAFWQKYMRQMFLQFVVCRDACQKGTPRACPSFGIVTVVQASLPLTVNHDTFFTVVDIGHHGFVHVDDHMLSGVHDDLQYPSDPFQVRHRPRGNFFCSQALGIGQVAPLQIPAAFESFSKNGFVG